MVIKVIGYFFVNILIFNWEIHWGNLFLCQISVYLFRIITFSLKKHDNQLERKIKLEIIYFI